ncbi:MAG TPA: hypothetical protein VER58_19645 [Thermoanaerobaculia bacterium]|nr:hypothetical protein [Thermoanaerobaculia bacterium]
MRDRGAIVLIAAVWLLSALIWLRPGITKPDGVAYYAYLPSTYFDTDLLLFNEWQHFGMLENGIIASEGLTPNGHLADHWTAGSAVVWFPGFLAADVVRGFVPSLQRFARDGVSLPYNAGAVSASAMCGLIALLAGYAVGRAFAPIWAATVATIAIWFGSSLLWYSTREALMAHAVSAAVCALVVLASMRKDFLAAGVAAGLAFAVRPQNATFIIVPFVIAGLPAMRKWLSVAGGIVAGALPQIVVTVFLYGNPLNLFSISPANAQRPWHSFERFWAWQPLFSWYHGLGTWTPLLMVGIIGFPFLIRAHRGLGMAALLMLLAQWAANATIDRFFWAGSSFGQRRFDNCTIFFLLGAAALFTHLPKLLAIAIAALTSAWTMALFFTAAAIDLNRYYPPDALIGAMQRAPKPIGLLVAVPESFKIDVLIVFAATVIIYVVLALLMQAKPGIVAATLCLVMAGFFAVCGLNDASHMEAWTAVIAKNRQLEPYSGAVHDRIALLRDEENYLRATGAAAEADRTRGEITALEKSIPSAAQ